MANETMQPPHASPDPTNRTIETVEREVSFLQEWATLQLESAGTLSRERFAAQRREDDIREAHRLELKADNEKTVATAMVAAEKAVQAALAAAEKARDQQTIASQLATEKAEKAGKEQLQQQGETFSTAITSLTTGLGDVKTGLSELLAEKRGAVDTTTDRRAGNAQAIALISIGAVLLIGMLGLIVTVAIKVFGA